MQELACHGLECVAEMLGQLVSLIASDAVGTHTDMDEFGLELMNAALNAGGSGGQPPWMDPIEHSYRCQESWWKPREFMRGDCYAYKKRINK